MQQYRLGRMLATIAFGQWLCVNARTYYKGGSICAGGEGSASTAPKTYLCNCGTSGTTCTDQNGVIETIVSGVYTGSQTWAQSGTYVADPFPTPSFFGRRFHADANYQVSGTSATLATMTDGELFGSTAADAGMYLGTSSFVVKSGSFNYKTADFLSCGSGSTWWLTTTVSNICIIPSSTSTSTSFSCDATGRSATQGHFKFSLFGFTWGNNFASLSSVQGKTSLIFRQKVCLVGATLTSLNGNTNTNSILGTSTQITSIKITQNDALELTYSFPQSYVFGDTSTWSWTQTVWTWHWGTLTPSGSKTVRITAESLSGCRNSAPGISLHYAFEMADMNTADKFFAYDPKVSSSGSRRRASPSQTSFAWRVRFSTWVYSLATLSCTMQIILF